MALIKKIFSEKVRLHLGYWRIIDLTYNCNTGDLLLSLAGFFDKEAREQDSILNCLDTKTIKLHTKKQYESRPLMRIALNENGKPRYEVPGKLLLEATGEYEQVQINQDHTLELDMLSLSLQEIYAFLAGCDPFAGAEIDR